MPAKNAGEELSCNIERMGCHLCPTFLAVVLMFGFEAPLASAQQSGSQAAASPAAASVEPGELLDGTYHNRTIGFRYQVPFGWVDRTDEMRQAASDQDKSSVLLAVFERPPAAKGNTVNSAVVIAVEPASAYPGLKSAAQYFGPVTELTTAKGFQAVADPYEFPVDGRPIVRRDFLRPMGSISMHQSTLALLTKGSIVSFTFLGGSDDEVTALIEQLAFERVRKPAHK
ncbi:MAG TPA: hypothetical protein VEK33_05305 [Terriglobales bacterium]|nr:hypothetical protein [Terriglobales bacterium]